MNSQLLAPAQWAHSEFAPARLGDPRRSARLVKLASSLARSPGGTLPQALPRWADLKAAYRLLSQPRVTYLGILAPHWARTRAACQQPGEYLLIEDTTELDYTDHPATAELAPIGNGRGRGLRLHTTLAVRVEQWTGDHRPEGLVVGLFGQQCTHEEQPAPKKEKRGQRLQRARRSQRWAAVLIGVGPPPAASRWIYVADRESDFYEPIQRCRQQGVDFIIRAYQDRRLAGGGGRLRQALARAPVLGNLKIELRARGGQPARTARVEVRHLRAELSGPWRPGGGQPDFAAHVVEVCEVDPPAGVEPLHWTLLTSLSGATWEEACRIVGRYSARWWIEEYHKALKTGAGVEDSQLEHARRLESLVAVLAVVAVRLLSAKWLARVRADEPMPEAEVGPEALAILQAKLGAPRGGWTRQNVLIAIARLGGFLARRGDGWPGWQTIWRGWHRLRWMCEGLQTLSTTPKTCG